MLSRHDVCPEGYHGEEGDESGQCLPNDEGCHGDYVMIDEENYCYDPTTCCPHNPDEKSCQEYEGPILCPSTKLNRNSEFVPQIGDGPVLYFYFKLIKNLFF